MTLFLIINIKTVGGSGGILLRLIVNNVFNLQLSVGQYTVTAVLFNMFRISFSILQKSNLICLNSEGPQPGLNKGPQCKLIMAAT